MHLWFVLIIYNLLFPIVFLSLLPGYLIKVFRRGNYKNSFGERLGFFSVDKEKKLSQLERPIWIHAVSVGEVNIAKKFIDSLKKLYPSHSIVLSTTTPTGYSIASGSKADLVFYQPLDFFFIINRVFKLINPGCLVLTEAEVWPNLVNKANKKRVEVSLINARLSNRSRKRFEKYSFLTSPILKLLRRICIQEESDKKVWEKLGVGSDKIFFTGSIKFDRENIDSHIEIEEFRNLLKGLFQGEQRSVLLAGSTHPGEELMIARKFKKLKHEFPDLCYVVAPRHVERCKILFEELSKEGLKTQLRSQLDYEQSNQKNSNVIDCLIIDTTGELNAWYHLSDIVIVGKSFLSHGGQNPVEPIFAGKPVIVGPHMENFTALVSLLNKHEGIRQIDDSEMLIQSISEILYNTETADKMVIRANEALSCHQGASERTAKLITSKFF